MTRVNPHRALGLVVMAGTALGTIVVLCAAARVLLGEVGL